jgi:hypothetical protein
LTFLDIFLEIKNIELYENPSRVSRIVPCWQTGQTDKMKLIVALRTFAKTPKTGGRIKFMTMQKRFGSEPTPSVLLLCAIYLRTSLEKDRN